MDNSKEKCPHMNFQAVCKVGRITENENGPVMGYALDVKVNCIDCGQDFAFVGVEAGYSPDKPMASIDFTTLCAPMQPSTGEIASRSRYQVRPTPISTDKPN